MSENAKRKRPVYARGDAARRLRRAWLAGSALTLIAVPAYAAGTAQTWNGSTGTDWFTGANWDSTTVPATGDSATLDTVTPHPTVLSGAAGGYSAVDLNGLNVGFTSTGQLTINNHSSVTITNNNFVIGGDLSGVASSASGTVVLDASTLAVTGSPATSGMIAVGGSGTGSFTVQNGATVGTVDSYVGFGAGSNGTITVTGAGTTWTNSDGGGNGQNIVGNDGIGTFNVYNGATVTVDAGTFVGANATGTGTINISGTGSTWTASQITLLGGNSLSDGGRGTINVSDGGRYVAHNQTVIGFKHGGVGNFNVTGGATVTVDSNAVVNLGFFSDAIGTLTVSGAGSRWDASAGGDMYVGGNAGGLAPAGGTGTVNVLAGGALTMQGAMYLGRGSSGGNGTLNVSGAGSTVSLTTATESLFVGYTGVGALSIGNGGQVTNDGIAYLGFSAGSTGTAIIDGAGSSWTSNGLVTIIGGNDGSAAGGTGTVTVQNGGTLNTGQARLGFDSAGTAAGTVTVTGSNSRWNASDIYVGYSGNGALNISSGGRVDASGVVSIGECSCTTGTVSVTGAGSLLTVAGNLTVGDIGDGTLSVSDGGRVNVTGAVLGNGRLTIGAGSVVTAASYMPGSTVTTTFGLRGSSSGRIELGSGTAALAGALVITGHNAGRTTYTLVHSADLSATTFASVSYTTALRNPVLTYTTGDVLLTVDAYLLASLLPSNANANQRNVVQAIDSATTGGATLPAGFESIYYLSGDALLNALTQLSGETGTAPIQAGFFASNQFMSLLFDQGGSATGGSFGATGYAAEKKLEPKAAEAYAAVTPRDRRAPDFTSRWGVWGSAYGGNATVKGDASAGSNDTTSRVYGLAAGAEYRFTPDTVAGFALGGAGANFSSNGGSGRSDIFQAGAYLRHRLGAVYLSAALAYGWQRVSTDRSVTVSGTDKLEASFNAQTFAARLEGGYRFATPWIGLTPYGALQSTSFFLPSYAESATSGSNQFALAYSAQTTTNVRTELGVRFDRSLMVADRLLGLFGRAAWAHDSNNARAVTATFQTLPGSAFTVNGAKPAADAALLSVGADIGLGRGWSAAATFDGEFSRTMAGYSGKGRLAYAW